MGALTGNAIKDSYLDVVQLGQSGAGLPSHAGKEAALYDGAGNQILGRSAVRHWLDPHPDAASFAETWEFSTKGTMTQAALEAAGWTFENCTAAVSNGALWLTVTANGALVRASIAVSLSGDFDIYMTPISTGAATSLPYESTTNNSLGVLGLGVARYEAGITDLAHYNYYGAVNGTLRTDHFMYSGTWTALGGTDDSDNAYGTSQVTRAARYSGQITICTGSIGFPLQLGTHLNANSPSYIHNGWTRKTWVNDATTYNKLFLTPSNDTSCGPGTVWGCASIRRLQ